ncbi:MAG: hypothetical protein Q8L47_00315 [bacterium]|nr:hypothetical protein [bacterium]
MELLKKSTQNQTDKRKDNSDKNELYAKDRHPYPATFYKDYWNFVSDKMVRENIAYQMQYLEFMVHLYNDYQIYLTIESLLCKDIIVTTGGIIEAALFDLISSAKKKAGVEMGDRTDFTALLGLAYHEYKFIDESMWHFCHELRKARNLVHLKAADFQEHTAYTPEQANDCINKLEEFRMKLVK